MGFPALHKGDLVDLRIDQIAFGGSGVARHDGLVVFVRGAIPGDSVRAQVTKKKKDYAEARIVSLLEPSPDRVFAPCPYSGHCGGCQWQHVRYQRQLEYKKGHVQEALARIGNLSGVPIHDPISSDSVFGYRNKMEFSFASRLWLPAEDTDRKEGTLALGLHAPGTFYKVIDVEACLLIEEKGNEILRCVKKFAKESGLPAYDLKTHQGFWRFLTLRYSPSFKEWMVNIVTHEEKRTFLEAWAQNLRKTFPEVKTLVNNITARRASIAVGERERVLLGDGIITDRLGTYLFHISANSFFQTNSSGAFKLYQKVLEYAELTGRETVLDLYSGTGTIPVFLARSSKLVIGMEITASAVGDAERNCRSNGIENCSFILGDIRERLAGFRVKPDVLIIDPPRAGMHQEVLARAMELCAERIIYISCNPATLARDLGEMSRDYEASEIQPVDMFPHTYHIEVVAKLFRKK
jgi:23S rRNA (uracil1939-C5)-methyltransferase